MDSTSKDPIQSLVDFLKQKRDNSEAVKAGISLEKDGRAVIRALQSPDVSSMVHEIGHIFRRDLSDADLDVVAKLGELAGTDELRNLETTYRDGTLT